MTERERLMDELATAIVKQAKGDLLDALLLWRTLATDLHDVIERKVKEQKS